MADSDIDEELAELSLEEARRLVSEQIRTSEELSARAFETIKINVIVLSILVAAGQFAETRELMTLGLTTAPIFLSIVVAMVVYIGINPTMGLNEEGMSLLREESSGTAAKMGLAEAYTQWGRENQDQSIRIRRRLLFALGLTLSAIAWIGLTVLPI